MGLKSHDDAHCSLKSICRNDNSHDERHRRRCSGANVRSLISIHGPREVCRVLASVTSLDLVIARLRWRTGLGVLELVDVI